MNGMVSVLQPRLVRASAGTGKTFELSSRILGLILLGERPDRILATTFTKKAAGEIRERVLLRLARAGIDEASTARLGKELGIPSLSRKTVLEKLDELVRAQHRLSISTIDSLIVSFATMLGSELGFIEGWTLAELGGEDDRFSNAAEALIERLSEKDLITLLRTLRKGAASRSVIGTLLFRLKGLHEIFRLSDAEAWQWAEIAEHDAEAFALLVRHVAAAELPKTKEGKPNKVWEKARDALAERLGREAWELALDSGLVKAFIQDKPFSRVEIDDGFKGILARVVDSGRTILMNEYARRAEALVELLTHFDGAYQEIMRRERILSFSDLKFLLGDAVLKGDLEPLYFRLDSRIHHLLLDEFQDTSVSEWKVLEPIAAEILSQSGDRSFLCVGDTKQAIYGWRGGVSEIFDYLERRWPHLNVSEASESRRCSQPVLDFVNAFNLSAEDLGLERHLGNVWTEWQSAFREHRSALGVVEGFAAMHVLPQAGDDEERSDAEIRYEHIVSVVRELVHEGGHESIAVLARRNGVLSDLRDVLAVAAPELSVSLEGSSAISSKPWVARFLAFLWSIDHPGDSFARFQGSAIAEATAQKSAERIREEIFAHGLGRILAEWRDLVKARLSTIELRSLDQLVELGFEFDGGKGGTIAEFVGFVQRARVTGIERGTVRLMTFHQAKGLEFDAVVVTDLNERFLGKHEDLLSEYENRLDSPVRLGLPGNELLRMLEPRLERMHHSVQAARFKEELAVLYVGLTRPKSELHVVVSMPKGDPAGTFAGLLLRALRIDPASAAENPIVRRFGAVIRKGAALRDAPKVSPAPRKQILATRGGARGLEPWSPSRSEGGEELEVGELLRLPSTKALVKGRELHSTLQRIGWLDEETDEGLEGELRSVLEGSTEILAALGRSRFAGKTVELHRELPFAYRDDGKLVSGAFDRLVLIRDASGKPSSAEIIDFKTDRIEPKDLGARVEFYRPQVEAYRRAAVRLFGLRVEVVSVDLLFIRLGKVVRV